MTAAHVIVGFSIATVATVAAIGVRVTGALHVAHLAIDAAIGPDPVVWPTSIAGWVALAAALIGCAAVFVGWGRMLAKFDDVIKGLNEVKSKVNAVSLTVERMQDEHVVVQHTLWGPRGDDGIALQVRELDSRVDEIEERNNVRDALEERERGAAAHGDERRSRHRRREDRVVLGEEEIDR